jgi:hypothetical protein
MDTIPTTARPACHDCHAELYCEHGSSTWRAVGHGDSRCRATGGDHVVATCEFCDEPIDLDDIFAGCTAAPDHQHHCSALRDARANANPDGTVPSLLSPAR